MNLSELDDQLQKADSIACLLMMAVSFVGNKQERKALNEGIIQLRDTLQKASLLLADYNEFIERAGQESTSSIDNESLAPDLEAQNA